MSQINHLMLLSAIVTSDKDSISRFLTHDFINVFQRKIFQYKTLWKSYFGGKAQIPSLLDPLLERNENFTLQSEWPFEKITGYSDLPNFSYSNFFILHRQLKSSGKSSTHCNYCVHRRSLKKVHVKRFLTQLVTIHFRQELLVQYPVQIKQTLYSNLNLSPARCIKTLIILLFRKGSVLAWYGEY